MKTIVRIFLGVHFIIFGNVLAAQENTPSEAPLNPEFIKFQQNRPLLPAGVQNGHRLGYVPSPVQYHFGQAKLKKAEEVTFDPVYDLRTLGLLTAVRDQGDCGSCWAFEAYGSLESNWKKNGYGTFDFSENNLKNCHGFEWTPCEGGNRDVTTAYLARFSGPVNESSDPYSVTSTTCTSFIPDYYVPDVVFLPKDKNTLKQAIMDYGALATNMYFDDLSYRASDYTHFYNGTKTSTNHGVTLVGWNDNKVTASANPGAWIIKNSWGSSWGENGFFYVSYDDLNINSEVYCMPSRTTTNSSSTLYSIDKLGQVSSYGFSSNTAYALIKYTAVNNYPLRTVGTYANASNSVISFYVYDDFNTTTGALSNLIGSLENQTCLYPGYYTFSLPEPVSTTSGNDFYVKVKYITPDNNYPIPVEKSYAGYANPVIETGTCWMGSDGSTWTAMGKGTSRKYDLCIKVFASASKVWTGSSGTWNNPASWFPSGLPGPGDDILIPSGLTNQPSISSTTQADCRSLFNEGTITVNSDATSTGSLIVSGKVYGTGNVKFNRQIRTQANYGDYHYFSAPVVETVSNFITANSSKLSQIWEWQEPNATPWQIVASGSFVSGKGYNLVQKTGSDGLFVFTGSIVNSAGPVVATAPYSTPYATPYRTPWGGGGWNLLGNPFTSAMNASLFISANSGSFDPSYKAVYIYDGTVSPNGTYYVIADAAYTDPFNDFTYGNFSDYTAIQAGQGFFVLAKQNNVSFSFDKSMQVHNGAIPLKSAKKDEIWAGILLKVSYGDKENSTVVVYNENMTAGLDPGFDIGQLSTGPEVEIYTALVKDNGVNFTRQALPMDGNEKNAVPVGVDCENGAIVTFSAKTVAIGNGTFYLEDRSSGVVTDLSKDTYTVTLPAKTAGIGRFFIHSSLATGLQPLVANAKELSVRIWTSQNRLNIEGAVSSKATGAVYDLLGHRLLQMRLNDSSFNTITVPVSVKGIYMVKVTDGEKVATEKVVF